MHGTDSCFRRPTSIIEKKLPLNSTPCSTRLSPCLLSSLFSLNPHAPHTLLLRLNYDRNAGCAREPRPGQASKGKPAPPAHQHQPPTSAASSHPRHPVLCHQYHQRQRHPQCFVRTFSVLALGRSRHQTGGLVRACMWISAATSPQPLVSVLPPRSSRRRKQQPAPTVWATTCQQKATR